MTVATKVEIKSKAEGLMLLSNGKITVGEYADFEARQTAKEIAAAVAAAAPKPGELHAKVSEKGGVSVYGLNVRFPITLYKEQ